MKTWNSYIEFFIAYFPKMISKFWIRAKYPIFFVFIICIVITFADMLQCWIVDWKFTNTDTFSANFTTSFGIWAKCLVSYYYISIMSDSFIKTFLLSCKFIHLYICYMKSCYLFLHASSEIFLTKYSWWRQGIRDSFHLIELSKTGIKFILAA